MKLSGASGRTWLFILTVMVGTLIFVGIPQVALGSTYPPTPEVIMSVSSTAISPDSEAVISVEWHRHMIYGVIGFFSSLILFALILLVKDDNKAIS
jgi:hypothetical protein